MATVEAKTSTETGGQPGVAVYDGFISYSHAADDLLAPRLQAGLQRFAKPWWKRRALRMFRDESSLSANPHLWSSITDALDRSAWFVLLLSAEAAESEWVNQEVEYWVANKDADRIIPVLTDGEFRWAETDIDLESDAAPPALYGAFSDEPRWVDLRFARSEEQLDLQDPRFADAVADVASAIRGVPKDDLASEEVRQHRRTVRTAWLAGAGLLLLALVAGGAALFALDQRNEAQTQATEAEAAREAEAEQRDLAEENAAEAERQRTEAEASAVEAQEQAAVARGRELTLEAEKAVQSDPELSAHLGLAALAALRDAGEDTTQAVSALRAAVESDRVAWRIPGGDFVTVHPDGDLLATADGDDVAVWDIATRQVVERHVRDGEDGCPTPDGEDTPPRCFAVSASFSPDGNLLAVLYQGAEPPITVWDRTTTESFTLGTNPGPFAPESLVFSPDGELLAFADRGVEVWSITEREVVFRDELGSGADFTGDGLMSYAVRLTDEEGQDSSEVDVRIMDPTSWTLVDTFRVELAPALGANGGGFTSWSPDGTRIAVSDQQVVALLDASNGDVIGRTEGIVRVFRPEWLSDGSGLFVGGEVDPRVVDAGTGHVEFELVGLGGGIGTWGYDAVPGTTLVAAAALGPANFVRSGDTVLFETTPVIGELGGWLSPVDPGRAGVGTGFTEDGRVVVMGDFGEGSYVVADAVDGGNAQFYQGGTNLPFLPLMNDNGTFVSFADPDGTWTVRAADSGEVVYKAPLGWSVHGVSWDGSMAVISALPGAPEGSRDACGPTRLVSIPDGSPGPTLLSRDDYPDGDGVQCPTRATFSPDGSLVYLATCPCITSAELFDTATGEVLVDFTNTPYSHFYVGFTPDGREVVMGGGHQYVFDVETLLSGAPIESAIRDEFVAHDTNLNVIAVSPDGSMVLTADRQDPLKVWDLRTAELIGQFGGELQGEGGHFGDFHPTEPWLLVTSPPNEVRIHTLDVDELIQIATDGLSRPMTDQECEQYFRGPCPAG